jgi:hypothetical protein
MEAADGKSDNERPGTDILSVVFFRGGAILDKNSRSLQL